MVECGSSRVALWLAYCGEGFKGMQRNPGAPTIEGALELALLRSGLTTRSTSSSSSSSSSNKNKNNLQLKRAARTDKGVSAAAQLVSVTICIPSTSKQDQEQQQDHGLQIKQQQRQQEQQDQEQQRQQQLVDRINSNLPRSIRLLGCKIVHDPRFSAKAACIARVYEYLIPDFAFDARLHRGRANAGLGLQEGSAGPQKGMPGPRGLWNAQQRERLNAGVLRRYVGRRSFHNFSWKVSAGDAAAERCVLSMEAAEEMVEVCGVKMVKLVIKGQSFMLYQIRKMVGLAIAIMRGAAPAELIDLALSVDAGCGVVVVPTAPPVGLLLNDCVCSATASGISSDEFRAASEQFKRDLVYPHIARTCSDAFAAWLPSLNPRNYAAFLLPVSESGVINNPSCAATEHCVAT